MPSVQLGPSWKEFVPEDRFASSHWGMLFYTLLEFGPRYKVRRWPPCHRIAPPSARIFACGIRIWSARPSPLLRVQHPPAPVRLVATASAPAHHFSPAQLRHCLQWEDRSFGSFWVDLEGLKAMCRVTPMTEAEVRSAEARFEAGASLDVQVRTEGGLVGRDASNFEFLRKEPTAAGARPAGTTVWKFRDVKALHAGHMGNCASRVDMAEMQRARVQQYAAIIVARCRGWLIRARRSIEGRRLQELERKRLEEEAALETIAAEAKRERKRREAEAEAERVRAAEEERRLEQERVEREQREEQERVEREAREEQERIEREEQERVEREEAQRAAVEAERERVKREAEEAEARRVAELERLAKAEEEAIWGAERAAAAAERDLHPEARRLRRMLMEWDGERDARKRAAGKQSRQKRGALTARDAAAADDLSEIERFCVSLINRPRKAPGAAHRGLRELQPDPIEALMRKGSKRPSRIEPLPSDSIRSLSEIQLDDEAHLTPHPPSSARRRGGKGKGKKLPPMHGVVFRPRATE